MNGHPVDYLDQELDAAVDDAVVDVLLRAEVDLGAGRPRRRLLPQLALQLLRRLQAVLRGDQERADQHLQVQL